MISTWECFRSLQFHQFDQRTGQRSGMHERDPVPPSSDPGVTVDELDLLLGQVAQSLFNRGDCVGDVMEAFAVPGQEATNGGVRAQWLQQLDVGGPDRDHGFLDSLFFDDRAVFGTYVVLPLVFGEGAVEIVDGDADMIDVDQSHAGRLPRVDCAGIVCGEECAMSAVITGIARTPLGKFGGGLAPLRAVELGSEAIKGALDRAQLDPALVDEVIFGQVLQAGEGQITARQAAVRAGVPMTVPATTVNKVCLSGMTAVAMADRSVRLGEASFVVAGGMESMSNAPYLMPSARWGARMGDAQLIDVMMHDGLRCSFDHCAMGESSDLKNAQLGISRAAAGRLGCGKPSTGGAGGRNRSRSRMKSSRCRYHSARGDPIAVELDEGIRPDTTVESLARLKPAFTPDGTTTAANASQISDGAAAVIVADRRPPRQRDFRFWRKSLHTDRSVVPMPRCRNGLPRR